MNFYSIPCEFHALYFSLRFFFLLCISTGWRTYPSWLKCGYLCKENSKKFNTIRYNKIDLALSDLEQTVQLILSEIRVCILICLLSGSVFLNTWQWRRRITNLTIHILIVSQYQTRACKMRFSPSMRYHVIHTTSLVTSKRFEFLVISTAVSRRIEVNELRE